MRLAAVTFEVTSTLVCMSVPLGKVYGDALRHFKLDGIPDDGEMKDAFKRAYASTGKAMPNFGAAEGMPERVWWDTMIRSTLSEAGCDAALEDETFPLVFQRIYSSFGSSGVWAECPEGIAAMRHAKEARSRSAAVETCQRMRKQSIGLKKEICTAEQICSAPSLV